MNSICLAAYLGHGKMLEWILLRSNKDYDIDESDNVSRTTLIRQASLVTRMW